MNDAPCCRTLLAVASSLLLLCAVAVSAGDVPGDADSNAMPGPPEISPAAALHQAGELLMEGFHERAIEAYRALAGDEATRLDAALGLAECYLQTGRYDETRRLLQTHALVGEKSARWHMLAAEAAGKVGLYDKVVEHARQAIRLDGHLSRARLLLGETLELLGRREEALKHYEWFDALLAVRLPTDAENLTAVGQGFYRYSVLTRHPGLPRRTRHVLNEVFQAAYERVDRSYWPARVAAGDLLREKYNVEDAQQDYKAALLINSAAADAHAGLGRLALENWDFETIERRAHLALETNPNHCGALNLLATGKIIERRYHTAVGLCDRALAVNPNDIEALALKASANLALNDPTGAARLVERAEAVSPRNATLHRIIGDTLGGLRWFAEAEASYNKAISYEPTAARPRIELGLMYMQWGDEQKARDALDAAWNLDPFNEKAKNTLELLDNLESFDTVETDHFLIRFDGQRDEIVGRYCAQHLESIYDSVCDDYDARLERKTIVEVFPTHSQFGVRITGKPWIHTVGACTGWVIAMDSPRAGGDLQGPYNFAGVLRHEFTHTVTLAVTRNRIPHWFTEGLAVLQEEASKSYGWRELLAEAVRRDELFTLKSVDWGFMRPRRATDRQLAYAQSEWMCEYLIETYGYEIINRMLRRFAEAKTQEEIFVELTGEPPERLDERFAAWASGQVRSWGFDLKPPEEVYTLRAWAVVRSEEHDVHARLARAEYDRGNKQRALVAARKSVQLNDRDNVLGLEMLVRVLGDLVESAEDNATRAVYDDETFPRAGQLLRIDPENRFALRALGDIHLRRRQFDRALPLLVKLKRVWPLDPFAWRGLAGIYLEGGQFELALPELLEVARTNEHDADVPYQIGVIHQRRGNLPDARYWLLRSLYIDPFSLPAHERLATVLMQLEDTSAALEEYRVLCKLAPKKARYHADCAFAYHKLGDIDNARKYAARAVELDGNSPAAALLDD